MLINAHRPEQLRMAIIDGRDLEEYQVEISEAGLCRGNIYRGVVANIQPSLNAAFIDIGEERHGFLPADDVGPHAYHLKPDASVRRPRIDQILERKKPIYVQVTKDGAGQKGPALTTNLALAGRYLVLMPFDEVRAISRKAEGEGARDKVRERLEKLNLPEGHGVIVRTNGLDQNQMTLNRDLNALIRLWKRVKGAAQGKGPQLLYSDQDLFVQALRDYLDSSIASVIVDDDHAYEKAQAYMGAFMPRSKTKLVRYRERMPLFTRYALEAQIERIYERQVELPGGGSIVIDQTEALTAIDVNSGRATQNADHEESIFNVNVESAHEVGRQLRLRDIGGLVVIDFIDMRLRKHQRKLEKAMRDAMKVDKARNSVGRISPNGLVEINRQRIKQALSLRTHRQCPTCKGVGTVASAEFAAVSILRRIEARVVAGTVQSVLIALHPEVADGLQNGHRQELARLERELDMKIEVVSAPELKRSEERLEITQREGAPQRSAGTTLTAEDLASSGGRRRRRGGSKANAEAKAMDPEDVAEEPDREAGDDSDAKPKPKRRRRRRRSSKAASEGEQAAPQDAAQADGAGPDKPGRDDKTPDGGDEPAPRAHAPRGRSRAPKAEAAPAKAKAAPARKSEGDSRTAAPTGDGDGAPPKRRRRKRGGRRRKKTTTDEPGNSIAGAPKLPFGEDEQPPASYFDRQMKSGRARGRGGRRHPGLPEPPPPPPPSPNDPNRLPTGALTGSELASRGGKLKPPGWRWWRWNPDEDGGDGGGGPEGGGDPGKNQGGSGAGPDDGGQAESTD